MYRIGCIRLVFALLITTSIEVSRADSFSTDIVITPNDEVTLNPSGNTTISLLAENAQLDRNYCDVDKALKIGINLLYSQVKYVGDLINGIIDNFIEFPCDKEGEKEFLAMFDELQSQIQEIRVDFLRNKMKGFEKKLMNIKFHGVDNCAPEMEDFDGDLEEWEPFFLDPDMSAATASYFREYGTLRLLVLKMMVELNKSEAKKHQDKLKDVAKQLVKFGEEYFIVKYQNDNKVKYKIQDKLFDTLNAWRTLYGGKKEVKTYIRNKSHVALRIAGGNQPAWVSCWKKGKKTRDCRIEGHCMGKNGNWNACDGEKFWIVSLSGTYIRNQRFVGLRYEGNDSKDYDGKSPNWLSHYKKHTSVMPCPGTRFSPSINTCDGEAWKIVVEGKEYNDKIEHLDKIKLIPYKSDGNPLSLSLYCRYLCANIPVGQMTIFNWGSPNPTNI